MRRFLYFICFFLGWVISGNAQQKPQYTQYILNNYIINPALSGIESYIDVKAATRQQWAGLENAPRTSYFTIQMPIGNPDDFSSATSFGMVGENPLGRSYKPEYMASEPHHGVGFMVVSDKTGPLSNTTANFTYAYHLGLASKLNLAIGVGVGASRISLNTTDIKLENPNDPAIADKGTVSTIKPDISFGVWLYAVDYFAGASVQQLLPQEINFSDSSNPNAGKTKSHGFVTAGFRLWLSENITVIPSVMLKYVNPAPLSIDLNAKFAFKNKIWVGGSYRAGDASSAMLGFNLGSFLNVSYAYDFTTSDLNIVSRGSHEIVLGFTLNNHYQVTSPRNF
ncbi:PorP/SprF family type IX secretion system membrane protein [Pedobacter arcticus]|uniref:PorP/SprF family type IX secretion system membrane protein n=1 Tax=Pedobacter arcticus TaxID=752140 RepID=UPI0002D90171|nr:type IX secretion system membrane protein PorP/SprF [Pedobacter arcticus]